MKALRIKLYQNLCNFRFEKGFKYVQSYPLPPVSTVNGWVHSVLGLKKYEPLRVSIQGKSEAVITNVQQIFKFDRNSKDRKDGPYNFGVIRVGDRLKRVIRSIQYIDLHVNMNLLIHIYFENGDEFLIERLYAKILETVPVLGRNEDIARIDDLKIVNLKPFSGRRAYSLMPMYVIPEYLFESIGTYYRLPFWFEPTKSFEENRNFHYIEAYYIPKDVLLHKDLVLEDEDGNLVAFLFSKDKPGQFLKK